METNKNGRDVLVNFVQAVVAPNVRVVNDPYFSSIARTSVALNILNSEIQSVLFAQKIDESTENRTWAIFNKMTALCNDVTFGLLKRWTASLTEAREIVSNYLMQNLSRDMVDVFRRHKNGSLEPFSPESICLCEEVLDKMRIGGQPPRPLNQTMSIEYATWLVVDHMFYQLRGSCPEDARTAEIVEKCFDSKSAIPEEALVSCSNFLLDQFLSEEASAKKYGLTEQRETLKRVNESDALKASEVE